MSANVYINRMGVFLPNRPVSNDEMENFLGLVGGKRSRSKNIVLRNNRITTRYYALDESGKSTHSNADLAAEAVKRLFKDDFGPDDLELLACGTTTPDQLLPSHASMVHAKLGAGPIEAVAFSGACCAGMDALKYAWMSVLTGQVRRAVASASENVSCWMRSRNFEEEARTLAELEANPLVAFEKEFLRWMLSDGAGAVLLTAEPNREGRSLRVDWIDKVSYAHEVETCMCAGGERGDDGEVRGWFSFEPREWLERSIFSLKQDVRLLDQHIAALGVRSFADSLERHRLSPGDIDWFLPHLSSLYFQPKVAAEAARRGVLVPEERWFVNLTRVGNVGSASVYLALEELTASRDLRPGQRIMLFVPESARFSYSLALLSVV